MAKGAFGSKPFGTGPFGPSAEGGNGDGEASFGFNVTGAGDGQTHLVGDANFDFALVGAGDGQTSLVGEANFEFVADLCGTGILDGAGAADFDFATSGIGAYHRIPIRVVINQKNAPISRTAIGGRTAMAQLGARRAASLLGTQVVYDTTFRAAGTSIGGSYTHTEVTNG